MLIVLAEGPEYEVCTLANTIGGKDVDENYVVINGKCGNRRPVGPDEIVLTPAFAVALESEIGVVGDQVAIYVLHSLSRQFVRQLFQHLARMVVAFGAQ